VRRWSNIAAIVGALVAGCVVLVVPGWAGRVVQLYVAFLGVITAAVLVLRARSSFPAVPRRERARSKGAGGSAATPAFERMLRQVELGLGRGDDFEQFLRPELAAISARLLLRQGVVLEVQPERAAEVLGPALWRLVRPGRPLAPVPESGVSVADLSELLDRLEALA
jgi:hypothetical protein